jgi:hypothetical protein
VAISASALLIFAGNTAIIGSYHVFLALSRMEFFPEFVQQRNKLRGTPHFSILLAIAIPICVLVAVQGAITVLGGSVTLLGMGIAYFTYARKKQQGHVPVPITHVEEHLPGSMLAVLMPDTTHNEAVIRSAIQNAQGKPVTFLYLGHATTYQATRLFEYHDPYYDDQQARSTFGNAEHLAQKAMIARRYVYRQQEPQALERIWLVVHPRNIVISPENTSLFGEINPDRIRYEVTPDGRVAHLLKSW